jgi:hypothetical protein
MKLKRRDRPVPFVKFDGRDLTDGDPVFRSVRYPKVRPIDAKASRFSKHVGKRCVNPGPLSEVWL